MKVVGLADHEELNAARARSRRRLDASCIRGRSMARSPPVAPMPETARLIAKKREKARHEQSLSISLYTDIETVSVRANWSAEMMFQNRSDWEDHVKKFLLACSGVFVLAVAACAQAGPGRRRAPRALRRRLGGTTGNARHDGEAGTRRRRHAAGRRGHERQRRQHSTGTGGTSAAGTGGAAARPGTGGQRGTRQAGTRAPPVAAGQRPAPRRRSGQPAAAAAWPRRHDGHGGHDGHGRTRRHDGHRRNRRQHAGTTGTGGGGGTADAHQDARPRPRRLLLGSDRRAATRRSRERTIRSARPAAAVPRARAGTRPATSTPSRCST